MHELAQALLQLFSMFLDRHFGGDDIDRLRHDLAQAFQRNRLGRATAVALGIQPFERPGRGAPLCRFFGGGMNGFEEVDLAAQFGFLHFFGKRGVVPHFGANAGRVSADVLRRHGQRAAHRDQAEDLTLLHFVERCS